MSDNREKIIFLGSASGQTASLEPVSFLLLSSAVVLVETGPSVIRQLENAGMRPKDLDAVFVTHCHADHALGFPYLAFNKHIDRIENNDTVASLSIFCPDYLWRGLMASTAFNYPPGKFPTFDYWHTSLDEHPHGNISSGLKYECIPVDHTVPNTALKIITPTGKTIVYSSDTIYSEQLVEFARGADLLIQEAMLPSSEEVLSRRILHATIADAAKVARDSEAKRLVPVHMVPSLFPLEHEVISEIATIYSGPVVFPREGTTIDL